MEKIKQLAEDNKSVVGVLAAIGVAVVAKELFVWLRAGYKYGLRGGYDLKERYGDGWAVVTGASDGIGKELDKYCY